MSQATVKSSPRRRTIPAHEREWSRARFGYGDATASVTVVEGEFTSADVALEALPAGTIAGTATYVPSGHGLPGASVRVLDVQGAVRLTAARP